MAGGTIKQTVETNFVSKGGKKVQEQTEAIGRAQTRLGQGAASTGRQFSSQASGLGGLVAAYAGAAANVFALQQAFAALQRAAQAETIVRGTKTLALEIGESGKRILENIDAITQSQLTLQETAQSVNIALSAGFSADQIEKLTKISMQASRALGRSLTDAMTRVTRGAAKMEPELLDELGIFTRIDPAVEKYAATLNVATSSLTNYERRQAFANAVIEEGEKKFSMINTSMPSTQKSIEKLTKVLNDLAVGFGQLVGEYLTPFLDFISKNAGIALLAFGGILSLVFGKAAQLIGGFASKGIKDLAAWSNQLATTAAESKGSFKIIAAEASRLQVLQAADPKLKRPLVQDQGASFVKGFKRTETKALNEAMARFGTQISPEQMQKDMKLFDAAQQKMAGTTRKTSTAFRNAKFMAATYGDALGAAGAKATAFTWISTKLNSAISLLAKGFGLLGSAVSVIFAVVSVGQLVGTLLGFDFLKELKDLVTDTSQAFENFGKGLVGVVANAAGGTKALEDSLIRVGATDPDLKKVGDTLRDIESQALNMSKGMVNVDNSLKPLSNILLNVAQDQQERGELNPTAQRVLAAKSRITAAPLQDNTIEARIAGLKEYRKQLDITNKKDAQRRVLIDYLIKHLEKLGPAYELVGAAARQTGIATEKMANIFERISTISSGSKIKLTLLNREIDVTKTNYSDLSVETQKFIESEAILVNTLDAANKSFDEGSATSETLSKRLGGAQKRLKELTDHLASGFDYQTGDFSFLDFASPEQLAQLKKYNDEIAELNRRIRGLKEVEAVGKALTDVFGKYLKVLDEAFVKGQISAKGIAATEKERIQNQAEFLKYAIEGSRVQDALKKKKKEEDLNAIDKEALRVRERGLKVIAGMTFEVIQQIEKMIKKQDEVNKKLTIQLAILNAQLDVLKAQNKVKLDKAEETARAKSIKLDIDIVKAGVELDKERLNLLKQQSSDREAMLAITNKQLEVDRQIFEQHIEFQKLQYMRGRQGGAATLKDQIADMQFFPGLFTEEDTRAKKRELLDYEHKTALALLQIEEDQINRKHSLDRTRITEEETALKKKKKDNDDFLKGQEQIFITESLLKHVEQTEEMAIVTARIENLKLQKGVLDAQEKLNNKQLEAQKIQDEITQAGEQERFLAIKAQFEIVQKFAIAVGKDTPFVKAIEQFVGTQAQRLGMDKQKAQKAFREQLGAYTPGAPGTKTLIKELEESFKKSKTLRGSLRTARGEISEEKIKGKRGIIQGQIDSESALIERMATRHDLELKIEEKKQEIANSEVKAESARLQKELDGFAKRRTLLDNQLYLDLERLGIKKDAEIQTYNAAVNALKRQGNLTRQFGSEVSLAFQSDLKGSFNEFFTSVREGKGVLESAKEAWNSFVMKIIDSLQEKVTDKFIAPVLEKGMDTLFGKMFNAAGGPVHMAAGGAMRRDRVPAMLEPGEFVIRKPMAKAIGGPALHAMNSTGKGLTPNIEVIVNNQGTPKDADVNMKPQIDIDKMVVEIVTRDMRNNGPIRKTMRGE